MERALVAQCVANKLFAAEKSIDQSIADASALVAELMKAQAELGMSTVFADESVAKAIAATAALGQARSAMVAAHHGLEESKLRLGVRTKMVGSSDKSQSRLTEARDLREVA